MPPSLNRTRCCLGALLFFSIAAAVPAGLRADEYLGATSLLKGLSDPKLNANASPELVFHQEAKRLREEGGKLSPKEASERWLALADRYAKLPPPERQMPRPGFAEVVAALPPPPAWNTLADMILARYPVEKQTQPSAVAWAFLAHLLKDDRKGMDADVLRLEALVAKLPPGQRKGVAEPLRTLADAVAETSDDPARIVRAMEIRLALDPGEDESEEAAVPDLVALVGPVRAEQLLRKALYTTRKEITVPVGAATRKLARRVALDSVALIKVPQWQLTHSLEGQALYEALLKRFPRPLPQPEGARQGYYGADSRQTAQFYYVMSLVGKNRLKEAAALVVHVSSQVQTSAAVEELKAAGKRKELNQFFQMVLGAHPELDLWSDYLQSAAEVGASGEAVKLVKAVLARPRLKAETAESLQSILMSALLASDQVDEGVVLLRKRLAAPTGPNEASEKAGLALQLARLGKAAGKKEWLEAGLSATKKLLLTPNQQFSNESEELVVFLLKLDRGPEAERFLRDRLAQAEAQRAQRAEQRFFHSGGDDSDLVDLAGVYHWAGRPRDVLTVLDDSPHWTERDLRGVLRQSDGFEVPVGHMAAAALASQGKKEPAVRILRALLREGSLHDPAFQLLVDLDGERALPLLESLAAADPFQERPLIWKAYALLKAGKLEDAEKTARAAIAIDPSDGETHHGHRMRVYAVLADIREARGDANEARIFRSAVEAIRTGEVADEVLEAGLTERALGGYRKALSHFADAYCIQSRLAVQYASQGKMKEAEEHYRRAYELMPDSFGRMESHCFGCEGVFSGQLAGKVAEEVFGKLAAKNPERAQVHYLLAYLREEQGRYPEALQGYREAVRRDPDYLNAWKKLLGLREHTRISYEDASAASRNLLRLDPEGKHSGVSLTEMTDLRAIWNAVERVTERYSTAGELEPLYPLTASAAVLKAENGSTGVSRRGVPPGWRLGMGNFRRFNRFGSPDWMSEERLPSPGEVITQQGLVAAAMELISPTPVNGGRGF